MFFFIRKDRILLLISCDDHFDTFFQVFLCHMMPVVPHGSQCRFIDDVGQLRTGRTGCHTRDLLIVHVFIHTNFLRVNFQDVLSAFEIRQFYRNSPVKAARTQQCRIQGFRTVGRGQQNDPVVFFKAIHFGQQLVQRLLPFIVAHDSAVTLLSDGVDLVDKDDAWSLFLGLLEKVAHFRSTHTDKHFYKLRAGHGEKRHVGFPCYRLCKHGLTGSRRAYQQYALRHGSSDLSVLARIVKIFHDLCEIFLGLIFSCHVVKPDPFGGFDVDLGVALAHTEHHGVAAGLVHHLLRHVPSQEYKEDDRQHPVHQQGHPRGSLPLYLAGEFRTGFVQSFRQFIIIYHAGLIYDVLVFFICKYDFVFLRLDLHLADLFVFSHGNELAVIHFLDLTLLHPWHQNQVAE